MTALSDPKLEAFTQQLLRNLAKGMLRTKASEAAGREAGYTGSSAAANSRKRANRKDVKARLIELAAPAQEAAETDLTIDLEKAEERLAKIIFADIDTENVKAPDVIAAVRQLALMRGWNAPTRNEHTGKDGGPIEATTDADRLRALMALMARNGASAA